MGCAKNMLGRFILPPCMLVINPAEIESANGGQFHYPWMKRAYAGAIGGLPFR
jgi:hypothetical protein